jgi:hypothetical protein
VCSCVCLPHDYSAWACTYAFQCMSRSITLPLYVCIRVCVCCLCIVRLLSKGYCLLYACYCALGSPVSMNKKRVCMYDCGKCWLNDYHGVWFGLWRVVVTSRSLKVLSSLMGRARDDERTSRTHDTNQMAFLRLESSFIIRHGVP